MEDKTTEVPTMADHLKVPEPPGQIRKDENTGQTNSNGQQVEATASEETVINNNPEQNVPDGPKEGIVQNHDWNNGRPEVSKEGQETLETHQQTPEVKNDEKLRENKGNKEGEPVLEASEEVRTGQNAG